MGIIQSVLCSLTFCLERVLTWTCCAFLLILIMFTIIVLMVYGISMGYHYAQKELANSKINIINNNTTNTTNETSGNTTDTNVSTDSPKGTTVDTNGTPDDIISGTTEDNNDKTTEKVKEPRILRYGTEQPPELEPFKIHRRQRLNLFLDKSKTPFVLLQTEKPPAEPKFAQRQREIAKYLIGRFKRYRNITDAPTYTSTRFYRTFADRFLTNMTMKLN